MALSKRWIACAALGISVAASGCGDSDDSKVDDSNGKNDAGAPITIDEDDDEGKADASTGTDGCSGQGQQCMCADGQMGFQACMNGTLAECTCSLDLSDAGLPPPSDCTGGAACQSTMGFIKGAAGFCSPASDGGAAPAGPAIPPSCATKADCETAGLPAAARVMLMLPFPIGPQQLCVQPCTPAP